MVPSVQTGGLARPWRTGMRVACRAGGFVPSRTLQEEGSMASRFQQLEDQYTALDAKIAESPVKDALSVLHAMVHEVRRGAAAAGAANRQGLTIHDIAELYRRVPVMQGSAQHPGLPVGTRAPDFALPDAD